MTTARETSPCTMEYAKIAGTEVIVPSPKRFVREDVIMPDGYRCDWFYIDTPPSVMIVPITEAGEVVLVRQYRHNLRRHTLELPAGTVDRDEDFAKAAMRELVEETGYAPTGEMEPLSDCYSLPSETNKYTHIFRAVPVMWVGEPSGDAEIEKYFDMSVVTMPVEKALEAIGEEIISCETITALTLACR
jgi:ADP-ribose pyrophosphatase